MLNAWTTYAMSEMFRTAPRGAICRLEPTKLTSTRALMNPQVAEEKGKTINVLHLWICAPASSPSYMVDMMISDTKRPCPVNLYGRLKSYILLLDIALLQWKFLQLFHINQESQYFMNRLLGLGYIMSPKKISIWRIWGNIIMRPLLRMFVPNDKPLVTLTW